MSAAAIKTGSFAREAWNASAVPLKLALNTRRHTDLILYFVHGLDCVAERCVRSEIERKRDHGKLTLVVYSDRNGRRFHMCEGIEWHLASIRKCRSRSDR